MRLPVLIVAVLVLIGIFVDCYIWRRIVAVSRRRWPGVAYAWSSLFMLIFIIVAETFRQRRHSHLRDVDVVCLFFNLHPQVYILRHKRFQPRAEIVARTPLELL